MFTHYRLSQKVNFLERPSLINIMFLRAGLPSFVRAVENEVNRRGGVWQTGICAARFLANFTDTSPPLSLADRLHL